MLYKILINGVSRNNKQLSTEKTKALVTVLSKIANIYCLPLNAYQKIIGLCLRTLGTSKRTINKLSRLYESVSYNTLTNLLDKYSKDGKNNIKNLADDVVIHAGDNLDVRSKVRFECSGLSYHDIHLYNNMVYKTRIQVESLSNDLPPDFQTKDIDFAQFLLSSDEEAELLNLVVYNIMMSWKGSLSATKCNKVPKLKVKYSKEMASKTESVSFIILLAS